MSFAQLMCPAMRPLLLLNFYKKIQGVVRILPLRRCYTILLRIFSCLLVVYKFYALLYLNYTFHGQYHKLIDVFSICQNAKSINGSRISHEYEWDFTLIDWIETDSLLWNCSWFMHANISLISNEQYHPTSNLIWIIHYGPFILMAALVHFICIIY